VQLTFTNKLTWINCKTTFKTSYLKGEGCPAGKQRYFDIETTGIQCCEVLHCSVLAGLKTEQL
jgi:hypothetical protein